MQTAEHDPAPVHLEIFIDFICPWCYLAHGVVEKLKKKHKLEVNWLPFPLHPDTPAQGMLLSELFRGANVDAMHERLHALMDELQLPHCERDRLFNTRKAQELALWALEQGKGEAFIAALFKAYFAENRDISDEQVLLALAADSGLERNNAAQVLQQGDMAAQVDQAWQKARQLQIGGVPAFIGGGYQFSGFQPETEMERFLAFIRDREQAGKESGKEG